MPLMSGFRLSSSAVSGVMVQAGTGRHIIQDNRDAARLGHSGKVSHQTCLRGLVVIRGHQQQGIGTAGSRLCCQCTAVIGIIGTSTRNNRHPVVDRLDRKLDGGQLLLIGMVEHSPVVPQITIASVPRAI